MRGEGYKPFLPNKSFIPLEKVGVRGSEKRPGERRLTVIRAPEPEPQKTLLQEMQQYMTTRQSLREHGFFVAMGKEPANICLADATHNDLDATMFEDSLPDNSRDVISRGNIVRMEKVFDAYAISRF